VSRRWDGELLAAGQIYDGIARLRQSQCAWHDQENRKTKKRANHDASAIRKLEEVMSVMQSAAGGQKDERG
jgi:hypothetical protein